MTRNRYETVFIITPVLSDEQTKDVIKKYKDLLKDKGAKITHEENWGMRKLAYPIQKKSTGFYYLMEFEADASVILPFETEFRRDERVIRFLTTRMDKFHIEYAEGRRDRETDRREKPKQTAAGTETKA
ncbi:30S ribosomal protein S6 [Flavobacteriales bacterium]|jgi:small subunit ribosomal protein S6|nr:30S ribosomal protein S6 [Flavobacteriales bacterium]MDB4787314.1 30S ribosomal protein S6 [Flavobacteriales bacterium]